MVYEILEKYGRMKKWNIVRKNYKYKCRYLYNMINSANNVVSLMAAKIRTKIQKQRKKMVTIILGCLLRRAKFNLLSQTKPNGAQKDHWG